MQGDRTRGRRTMAQILGRGYARKQETLSLTSFAILSSIFSDTRPPQHQGVGSHSGANKGINTPFLKQSPRSKPFLTLNPVAKFAESNDCARLVGLRETYAPAAMALLLTSVIRVSLLHLELYGLNKRKGRNAWTSFSHIKRAEK